MNYMFVAALFVCGVAAHADTLDFGSFVGTSAVGLSNGVITYSNYTGTGPVLGYQNANYAQPFAGTAWVSYTTGDAPTNSTTTYTTSYTGNLAGDTGSLSVMVDNDVTVYLNGDLLGSWGSYTSPATFGIASSDFVNGVNTFTFDVLNDSTGGPTAFDFSAQATGAPVISATPEPSSFLLLGTGVLGILGVVRRRLV